MEMVQNTILLHVAYVQRWIAPDTKKKMHTKTTVRKH